uniref:Fimbrial biogenesis outer membrane usher protein n=1 Tax=Anisakis simplex TaxID=6269 RepID=A0A0M3J2M5_ANISI
LQKTRVILRDKYATGAPFLQHSASRATDSKTLSFRLTSGLVGVFSGIQFNFLGYQFSNISAWTRRYSVGGRWRTLEADRRFAIGRQTTSSARGPCEQR